MKIYKVAYLRPLLHCIYPPMTGTGLRFASQLIQANKSAKDTGVACGKLSWLEFPNLRSPDCKNVERMKNLVGKQRGYRPADLQHRIPPVINEATLDEAFGALGMSQEALLSPGPDYP